MPSLKVYGWTSQRYYKGKPQARCIVAASSWAEAARLSGDKAHLMRTYGSTTSNAREVEAAMAQPGVVLARVLDDWTGEYEPLPAD